MSVFLNNSYKKLQDFYIEEHDHIHWEYPQRIVGDWYFLDSKKAKPRPFSPPPEARKKFFDTMAEKVQDEPYFRSKKARSILANAWEELVKEIDYRILVLEEDRSQGISRSNSLATFTGDRVILKTLRDAGCRTLKQVRGLTNDQLKKIKGIDKRRVLQVRKAVKQPAEPSAQKVLSF